MILYLRTSGWTPPRRRLAVSMACAAATGALWWAGAGERNAPLHRSQPPAADRGSAAGWEGSSAGVQHVREPVARAAKQGSAARADAAKRPAVDAEGAIPFGYVGQWTDAGITRVVLRDRGRNVVVRVPGDVDGRYRAVSIDENRLVLKDMPLGTLRTLALVPGASVKAAPAAIAAIPDAEPESGALSTVVAPGVHVTQISVPAVPAPVPAYQDTEQAEN